MSERLTEQQIASLEADAKEGCYDCANDEAVLRLLAELRLLTRERDEARMAVAGLKTIVECKEEKIAELQAWKKQIEEDGEPSLAAMRAERDAALVSDEYHKKKLEDWQANISVDTVLRKCEDARRRVTEERDALRAQLEENEHCIAGWKFQVENLRAQIAAQLVELSKLGNVAWVQLGNHPGLPEGVRAILQAVQDAGMRAAVGGAVALDAECPTEPGEKTKGNP